MRSARLLCLLAVVIVVAAGRSPDLPLTESRFSVYTSYFSFFLRFRCESCSIGDAGHSTCCQIDIQQAAAENSSYMHRPIEQVHGSYRTMLSGAFVHLCAWIRTSMPGYDYVTPLVW